MRSCSAPSATPEFDSLPANRRPEAALLQLRQRLGPLRESASGPGLAGPRERGSPEAGSAGATPTCSSFASSPAGCITASRAGFQPTARWPGTRCGIREARSSASPASRSRPPGCASATSRRSTRPTCSRPHASGAMSSTTSRRIIRTSALDHMYVDSCAMRVTLAPASFDVIVTENMFGDILSDEAGAIVGIAWPPAVGEPGRRHRPVRTGARHGAGHRRSGRGQPVGAILSAAMLLRHALKLDAEATAVEAAVGAAIARRAARATSAASRPAARSPGRRRGDQAVIVLGDVSIQLQRLRRRARAGIGERLLPQRGRAHQAAHPHRFDRGARHEHQRALLLQAFVQHVHRAQVQRGRVVLVRLGRFLRTCARSRLRPGRG